MSEALRNILPYVSGDTLQCRSEARARCGPASASVIAHLRARYSEMLHNAVIYSPTYGRAELLDGLLCYDDGDSAVLVGFELDRSNVPIASRAASAIQRLWARHGPALSSLEYWGPERPCPSGIPEGLRCQRAIAPAIENCDVVLSLSGLSQTTVKEYRFVRRALRAGLAAKLNLTKSLSESHDRLVGEFLATHPALGPDEHLYVSSWRQVLGDPSSRLFEVLDGDRLTGFAILSLFSSRVPTYAFGFFENSCAGTSDLAHMAMISYCIECGAEAVDLGYSIHANLLRYKRKWGNTTFLQPPWDIVWTPGRRIALGDVVG